MSAAPQVTEIRRTRPRPQPIRLREGEQAEVVERVKEFVRTIEQSRMQERDRRVQLHAKLMQVSTEDRGDFSDVQLPDILTAVLRTEDTLQNSAMATRPMINTRALTKENTERERKNDLLLDQQFFVDQDGESLLEKATMNFVRDGELNILTRWVRELRKILYTRSFGPIEFGTAPTDYFKELIDEVFPSSRKLPMEEGDGWDWEVTVGKQEYRVRFYTEEDGDVTLQVEAEVIHFEGPCSLVYGWDDVLYPAWALNLQAPGPSNPGGAPYVILVDYPTLDEIKRGIEAGFYDLMTMEEAEALDGVSDWASPNRELAEQRRNIQGHDRSSRKEEDPDHETMRRLWCCDVWGGLDVVWTILDSGPGYLLRARPMTEESPQFPPRRPIAHSVMIPLQDTAKGMGLPELMESIHDVQCESFNMMRDAGVFEMFPWFTYRSSSNIKREDIRIGPGVGIPLQNPQSDLVPQRFTPQATQLGANLIALGESMQEKLISIGDLQLGRIPAGKSSALRTSGGIQQVLAQGEARPERILRRFFKPLVEVFRTMHALNRHFLKGERKLRVLGVSKPDEDPFLEIRGSEDLVDAVFDFHANVLNSSKAALQQALVEIMNLSSNPLMLQLGVSNPETVYRVLSDYTTSLGQSPEKYWSAPTPEAEEPPVSAEDAINQVLQGRIPSGPPFEGDFEKHVNRMSEILSAPDESGEPVGNLLSDPEKQRLSLYLAQIAQRARAAQKQAELLSAAQQAQSAAQQRPGGGSSAAQGRGGPTLVSPNETIDDTLPVGTGTPQ